MATQLQRIQGIAGWGSGQAPALKVSPQEVPIPADVARVAARNGVPFSAATTADDAAKRMQAGLAARAVNPPALDIIGGDK